MIRPLITGFALTLRHFFKPKITVNYPEQKIPLFPKYRGKQVLMRDENDLEKCVACGLCAVACPADAIYLEAAENDGTVQAGPRYAKTYQIHKTRCIFCGYCEEACPVQAIVLGPGLFVPPTDGPNFPGQPATAPIYAKVDAGEQRARDSDARNILETELKREEAKLAEMQKGGKALTRPELAVLLAYGKMWLSDEMLASDLPEDPWVGTALARRRWASWSHRSAGWRPVAGPDWRGICGDSLDHHGERERLHTAGSGDDGMRPGRHRCGRECHAAGVVAGAHQ